jgi:hypothetical protein
MPDEYTLTLRELDQTRADFALIEEHLEILAGSSLASRPARNRPATRSVSSSRRRPRRRSRFVVHRVLALLPVTRAGPIIVAVIAALISAPLSAREYRSREVAREFQREHPCPSTGKTSGGCPGYRKDHIIPLACGGPDAVSNLQWQTVRDARAKDRWERKGCAR